MLNLPERYFFNPFVITFLMIVAFMLAVRPASAGGVPAANGGIGGSAGVSINEPVPTVMNRETLSMNTEHSQENGSIMTMSGIVLSKDKTSLTLQTLGGQRKLSVSQDTVFKSNNEIVSIEDINRGDIISATINNRGDLLQTSKNTGISGALQGLLALIAVSAAGAGAATHIYLRGAHKLHQLPTPNRYYLR